VTSNDIICNGGINPYYQPVSNVIYPVHAGCDRLPAPRRRPLTTPRSSTFTAQWHHTIVGAIANDTEEPIATNHKGPITSYMAKVHNATNLNATGLSWFKVRGRGSPARHAPR
jgi:cellulase